MEHKSLSWLAFLLLLQLAWHLPMVLAADTPVKVTAPGKTAVATRGEEPRKVEANWDRDLFAIFREGSEENKSEPLRFMPHPRAAFPEVAEVREVKEVKEIKKIVELKEPKVQGIVIAEDDAPAIALVAGKIVRPGDPIDGWLIRSINQHSITISGPGGERECGLLAGRAQARVYSEPAGGAE